MYRRIEQRIDRMLDNGLEAEVSALMKRGYDRNLPSLQGLGYRQFIDYFLGRTTREEAIALLKRDTKRYAKRQFTWFRREPGVIWVDITGLEQANHIAERIKKSVEISNEVV